MRKTVIVSMLVLLASCWIVGQTYGETPVDDCNYEEVCKEWCENPGRYMITCNSETPVDDCNYEEVCKDWCEDPEDPGEIEEEICIPTDLILFELNIGILKIIGSVDL